MLKAETIINMTQMEHGLSFENCIHILRIEYNNTHITMCIRYYKLSLITTNLFNLFC